MKSNKQRRTEILAHRKERATAGVARASKDPRNLVVAAAANTAPAIRSSWRRRTAMVSLNLSPAATMWTNRSCPPAAKPKRSGVPPNRSGGTRSQRAMSNRTLYAAAPVEESSVNAVVELVASILKASRRSKHVASTSQPLPRRSHAPFTVTRSTERPASCQSSMPPRPRR